MKTISIFFLLFLIKLTPITCFCKTIDIEIHNIALVNNSIDKSKYYKTLSDISLTSIDKMLAELDNAKISTTVNAYKGSLLMKKASIIKIIAKKLDCFKKGRQLLETEIKKHPQNIEYRFLRLLTQEHAPKFLKYNTNISSDKKLIINEFKQINKALQNIIIEYSKSSNILNENELKTQR